MLVTAEAVASPTDMALHSVELVIDDQLLKIEPADNAVFPEEAAAILHRIADNCLKNKAA